MAAAAAFEELGTAPLGGAQPCARPTPAVVAAAFSALAEGSVSVVALLSAGSGQARGAVLLPSALCDVSVLACPVFSRGRLQPRF